MRKPPLTGRGHRCPLKLKRRSEPPLPSIRVWLQLHIPAGARAMTQIVETHVMKRGVVGSVFLVLFWVFNGAMALWAFMAFEILARHAPGDALGQSDAYRAGASAGAAIGGTIAGATILAVWVSGAVILGLLVLLAPGQRTIVTRPEIV